MLPSALFDTRGEAMQALGLTPEEVEKTVGLMVGNLDFIFKGTDKRPVLHIGRQYFAVVEKSDAMDWLWCIFPDFRCVSVHEYVVVELGSLHQAAIYKMRWC